jgi:hypothetical protein
MATCPVIITVGTDQPEHSILTVTPLRLAVMPAEEVVALTVWEAVLPEAEGQEIKIP